MKVAPFESRVFLDGYRAFVLKSIFEKAFLWGVVGPLSIYVIGLKLIRVLTVVNISTSWDLFELIRSDALILIGFTTLGIFLLRNLGRFLGNNWIMWGLQTVAVVWLLLESVAHQFYTVTGSFFDLYLLTFSVTKLDDTYSVISSEVPIHFLVALLIFLVVIIVMPAVFARKLALLEQRETSPQNGDSWSGRLIMLPICFVSVLFATISAKGEDFAYISRSNLINIVFTLDQALDVNTEFVSRSSLDGIHLSPGLDQDSMVTGKSGKNLVFIILESTRASATTIHNKKLATTPFLASLAKESLVAERAYAVVPHTSKALVAILCGVEPKLEMPISEAEPGAIPAPCMANMLKDVGYKTVFMQSATRRFESREGMVRNMGYEDFMSLEDMDATGMEKANYFGPEDAIMLEPSERWLEENGNTGPFFATYLTLTPHHNYLAPSKRYGRLNFSPADELNRYLNSVYYVDQFVRELIQQYKRLGLYDNTLFVILGDHGEGFGEHGRSQHDNVIWEEGIHVPLLIHDPSNPVHSSIPYPVSHLDLLPTVAEELNFRILGGELPGIAFSQANEERRVYAHCWYQLRCLAVVGQRYKLIDHFGKRNAEYYDLSEDPFEKSNLATVMDSDNKQRLRSELYAWRQGVNELYNRQKSYQFAMKNR